MYNILSLFQTIEKLVSDVVVWIFSSESSGFLTLMTGLVAWYVYTSQNNLRQKEAAIVLLNEIKTAEKVIDQIKNNGFDVQNESILILPRVNSWESSYKIFAGKIRQREFELLNNFFNNCFAAQQELDQWRKYYVVSREMKAAAIQSKLIEIANSSDDVYKDQRTKIITRANNEDFLFEFIKPREYFMKYISSIQLVSGTTAMNMIEDIIKK